jgi:hypothetical protein
LSQPEREALQGSQFLVVAIDGTDAKPSARVNSEGKKNPLTKKVPKLLTAIRGNAILVLLQIEKGFHDENVWGPFSFAASCPFASLR